MVTDAIAQARKRASAKLTKMQTAPDVGKRIWEILGTIQDPELPISVIDLGLIEDVTVRGRTAHVRMIPTYSACPAIEVMRQDIRQKLSEIPDLDRVEVDLSFEVPWTMDRMSERGRRQLVQHGLSMPASRQSQTVECPFCGSTNTVLENLFGPTLCRAIYYCNACKNPIERFKAPA